MTRPALTSARAARRPAIRTRGVRRLAIERLEPRCLLANAAAPVLAPECTKATNLGTAVTADNGSSSTPLTFQIPNATSGLYYSLFDVSSPAAPVLLSGPVFMLVGNTITASNLALSDGVHQIAYTTAASPGGTPSAFSDAASIAVETGLHVLSISPSNGSLVGPPGSPVVVTFNGWLSGLTPDKADGSGFAGNPFAVMLVPSGPEGGGQFAKQAPLWSAPYGVDGGDLPVPATLVYHANADGTSTITLTTPFWGLNTDIYLVSISGNLTDLAGNALSDAQGHAGTQYSSFDQHASYQDSSPLAVTSVTAANGAIAINNNQIPQPDTIAIAFNKPLDLWTANSSTIHLLARSGPAGVSEMAAAVAYSPSTNTAYLTPEATLVPGTVYYVRVDTTVSDDQALPNPGNALAQPFITSFTVNAPGAGLGQAPLTVTGTTPANGTAWPSRLGYGAVTFSEPINLASFGRYSAMLVPKTGGVTTGGSGYADVPLNAKLAFNPNTNQLIIVPTTGLLPSGVVYLFSLSGIHATNGDALGNAPVYSTFMLDYAPRPLGGPPAAASHAAVATPPAVGAATSAPVASASVARAVVTSAPARSPVRPAQALNAAAVDRLLARTGALFDGTSGF